MKRLSVLAATLVVLGTAALPAFGAEGTKDNGLAQIKNVQIGARNASTGWTDLFDSVYDNTAGKNSNTAEKFTGAIAGAGIGTRKMIHRTSSGLIDLATFWIPKKEPLLTPIPKKPASHAQTQNFTHT